MKVKLSRIKLTEVLKYLFPKSCFQIQLEVYKIYEKLGIDIVLTKNKELSKEGSSLCGFDRYGEYSIQAVKRENNAVLNRVEDYSKLYTRKQMRIKF